MSYSIVFLDIHYDHSFYKNKVAQICGFDLLTISTNAQLTQMRQAISFAFKNSDAVFIVFPKRLWHKLQKIMLLDFERPSVFKEESYVIAAGFKRFGEGLFADSVYNKPFVFLSEEIDDSLDLKLLSPFFDTKKLNIGVFEPNLHTPYTVFTNGVYTLLSANKLELINLNINPIKIYTYAAQTPALSLLSVLTEKSICASVIETSGGVIGGKILGCRKLSNYFLQYSYFSANNKSIVDFLGIDEKYLNKIGLFSETAAKELAYSALIASGAQVCLSVVSIEAMDKFIFCTATLNGIYDVKIKDFEIGSKNSNINEQNAADYGILFLREFILKHFV